MVAIAESPVHLGRYTLRQRLAAGGMAEVYLATCADFPDQPREVVIKRILPRLVDHPAYRRMFADEARLAARLQHRNIVQAYGFHDDPAGPYIVFEYVRGPSLATALRRATEPGVPFPWAVALTIARDVAAGLHHAHALTDLDGTPLNIVHRDISPGNILLGLDGTVKLIDFGIAIARGRKTHTANGVIKGKPGYMAPEQYLGDADRRADIYALGVVLFEMTTGTPLVRRGVASDLVRAVTCVPRPSSRTAWYPPALEQIVLRALAQNPADRHATAAELLDDLEGFATHSGFGLSPVQLAHFTREAMRRAPATAPAEGTRPARPGDAPTPVQTPTARSAADGATTVIELRATPRAAVTDARQPTNAAPPGASFTVTSIDGPATRVDVTEAPTTVIAAAAPAHAPPLTIADQATSIFEHRARPRTPPLGVPRTAVIPVATRADPTPFLVRVAPSPPPRPEASSALRITLVAMIVLLAVALVVTFATA